MKAWELALPEPSVAWAVSEPVPGALSPVPCEVLEAPPVMVAVLSLLPEMEQPMTRSRGKEIR